MNRVRPTTGSSVAKVTAFVLLWLATVPQQAAANDEPKPEGAAPAAPARKELVVTDEARRQWAFQPLRPVEPPQVKNAHWTRTTIDRFILSALEAKGLEPSAPASARTAMRRVSFDVTGLPPEPQDVEMFCEAAAQKPQTALETLVDRLLDSRHYGERWGRHWLDVARYADSDGQESDTDRPNAYHYRDFVIRALNDDLPFDTFVRWQLAGDEYDPDNPMAVSATGFLTAGPSIKLDVPMQDEKLRTRYNELDDMVSTIGTGLLGLTLACARCHDHKYDPIPTRDYYRILCSLHGGDRDNVMLGSRTEVAAYKHRRPEWESAFKTAESRLKDWVKEQKSFLGPTLRGARIAALPISADEKALLCDPSNSNEAKALAKKHEKALAISDDDFRRAMTDAQRGMWDQLGFEARVVRDREPKSPPTALAFRDFGAEPATTWLFRRGDYYDHDEPVQLGFLTVLTSGRTPDAYWQSARAERPLEGSTYQRKALAEWIADPEHGAGALLARVIVNRVWQHHFGEGLVRTVSDFGKNGERPTHPDLLEWLASDFVAHGWKLKRLHRLILTSAAYLQDAVFDPDKARVDPENRLLWRRQPRRLQAEILRDSVLAVSGSLNLDPYGPAFKPSIPRDAMVARNIKSPYPTDIQDSAATRRRSVYLFHKRVIPYPLLQAFDAPDAQQSCGRRIDTTVAPQALALFNDPFIRGCAMVFANRLQRDGGHWIERWIERGYELALGRPPRESEQTASVQFIQTQLERRRSREPTISTEESQGKALADFCQTLFGLNEFLYVD